MQKHTTFLQEHARYAATLQDIKSELYGRYNVKRGLRNDDGTGVLVGLTEIGDVHGYIMDEQERIPVDGRLSYRGIDVYDIVQGFQNDQRFGFEECVYLLLFGKQPNALALQQFNEVLSDYRILPKGLAEDLVLRHPSPDIMNKLAHAVLVCYAHDSDPENYQTENLLRQSLELIARLPSLVAFAYQSKRRFFDNESLHIHYPVAGHGTAQNFLHMIRPGGDFTELEAEILDLSLVLHAEHGGGNNSAFTVRVVSSAYTDTYSAISAAIGSLKGLRHGGANNRVMGMMAELKQTVGEAPHEGKVREYLARLLQKQAYDHSGLIYGMGHAIYTKSDPRAVLLEKKASELAKAKGGEAEAEFFLYKLVEKIVPEVFWEVKKSVKVVAPNVDFFSGFVYKTLGIPQELYTPIFAISRIAGWCAHRIEELSGDSRIIRPAYKNVSGHRGYIPMKAR